MFTFFEKLLEPFPPETPTQPPATLFAFCHHYTKGVWLWLIAMAVLTALFSGLEILLYGFLANIVDWLGNADRATFLSQEGDTLFWLGVLVLVVLPLLALAHSLLMHQTVIGNYPMRIRWKAHRYLLASKLRILSRRVRRSCSNQSHANSARCTRSHYESR